MSAPKNRIRNFAIIAHIDHGKSTLADRLMEATGLISDRDKKAQYLDRMELEQERGITIKAQTVQLTWRDPTGEEFVLNLIDTPGHVDFSYEVSRSLAACEGALLIVDAAQGVEAQTLSNVYLALEQDLEIIPVLNKIDLPSAEPDRVLGEIEDTVGLPTDNAVMCSAKTGEGIADVLQAITEFVPPPTGDRDAPLQALIFDSWFDSYVGVIIQVRVMHGRIRKGDRIKMMATGAIHDVTKIGVFAPEPREVESLEAGDSGFVVSGIKTLADAQVGDTLTHKDNGAKTPLPGFKEVKPMVFSGIYPIDSSDYESLRSALEKLRLNDSAFNYQPETSDALGFGFRCGYLGLLHMEIVQERLEREYNLELINTSPSVVYKVLTKQGQEMEIHSPSQLPDVGNIDSIAEPIAKLTLHVPERFVGPVLKLCEDRRGTQIAFDYSGPGRVLLTYEVPYAEVVYDFFDRLKSCSKGYASMDYEIVRWQPDQLIRLDILVNGEKVDALSTIVHKERAYRTGQALTTKLKEFIPRQMWAVAIQAAVGAKVLARTTVKAMRKDVTAKCYGGDISRKRKLLERQKKGKKRMKAIGNVEVPQEAFLAVLKVGDGG